MVENLTTSIQTHPFEGSEFKEFPIFWKMGELGDMDLQTHSIQIRLNSNVDGVPGKMYGEFSKLTNKPDGRRIFVSRKDIILLYMKDGLRLNGSPEWHINCGTSTSRIN